MADGDSSIAPATCSSQRPTNSKRANQTLCCFGLAKLPRTLCTVRTTHCTLGTHCTLHWIINCLPTWQAGWLAGTSPSPLTLSPLTTHHSPLPQPCRVIQVLSSITLLLQCCYPAHRRASPNTLSILFFTLTREHSHLVVVSAPHIQLGHRNQPLSSSSATANESVMIDDSITARKRQAGVSSHADSSR